MTVVTILYNIRYIIFILFIARMVISFLPNANESHPLVRFVYNVTEPIMAPFRAILPSTAGIDFSPLLALFAIDVVIRVVSAAIMGM